MAWWLLLACGGTDDGVTESGVSATPGTSTIPTTSTTTPEPTGPLPDPCDPADGLSVDDVKVDQPWSEHEARFTVSLLEPAAVAVACVLDGDEREVHLVEGPRAEAGHVLRLAGLLASSTYRCTVAPVCPSSPDEPVSVELTTGPSSNELLPTIELVEHADEAGTDYVVTNHQRNASFNGQRRLVMDREARIRWHAHPSAGDYVGGSAVSWSKASGTFTIGGGWPPNDKGRAQQIGLYGSNTRYDTLPHIPDAGSRSFHHEARELYDGRLLSMTEPRIQRPGDQGSFRGFGFVIVDPATDAVDFDWSSQRPFDDGDLGGGGGDAYHANWADVYPVDGQDVLHVSLCIQSSVVAIDVPSGEWRWTFGAGGDFALVDADGNPLPDSEFPQCQHGLQRRGDHLLVYDNGQSRGFSRAVEFELDESTMTATRKWVWTEPGWFEKNLGGVDYTSVGVLIAMGHPENATDSPGDRTTFVEIDPVTGTKLWEARYADVTDMAFRAYAVPPCDLFTNARYCDTTAERLAALAPVLSP